MGQTLEVTDDTFQAEVLDSDIPVLVDFWAEWRGPCKMIAPIVEELAGEYEGKMKVAKVDVDTNPTTPSTYNVRGIPTLLIFNGGSPVDQVVGALPKAALKGRIDKAIS